MLINGMVEHTKNKMKHLVMIIYIVLDAKLKWPSNTATVFFIKSYNTLQ